MTRRKAAGLLIGLPLALGFSTGVALAQDPSTTVSKSSSPPAANSPTATATTTTGSVTKPQGLTQPQEELRPSINGGEEPTGAAPPADEIAPAAMDEGAGWEAAVEAAPGPTPLIGDQETKAVQRINAYFNGITNLQGSFDQVDFDQQARHGPLLRSEARQDQVRLRPSELSSHRRRRRFPRDRRLRT